MGNPWSPSAVQRCSRNQNTKKMGRLSAGQKYVWWSVENINRSPSETVFFYLLHLSDCFTQVFFLQRGDQPKGGASDSAEHNRLTERIARAFCLALCPHLKLLKEDGMAKLGLRVTFDPQEVRKKRCSVFGIGERGHSNILLPISQTKIGLLSTRFHESTSCKEDE